jgi:hypothetical protein
MKICLLMYLALRPAQDSFCHDRALGLLQDIVEHSHHVHPAPVHENQRFQLKNSSQILQLCWFVLIGIAAILVFT